jgi:uncharacterized membrane protein
MSKQITQSIHVRRPVAELYALWSNFENFPNFMKHIESVKKLDDSPRASRWKMDGPLGTKFEWEAETTLNEPNKRIAWNSKDNSSIKTSGQVAFNSLTPGETQVTVTLTYDPPGGPAGDAAAKWLVKLEERVAEDLKNFKAYAEGMPERSTAH